MNDKEIKKEIMSEMMADLVGITDDPQSAFALADHLIRCGWRKDNSAQPKGELGTPNLGSAGDPNLGYAGTQLKDNEDYCTCKEPKQTYPGQDYCRRCGELIEDTSESLGIRIEEDLNNTIAKNDRLKQENEELKAAQQRSLQSFAEHHEAEVKDLKQEISDMKIEHNFEHETSEAEIKKLTQHIQELQERLDWFDNLVEHEISRSKYGSLQAYVESLEQKIRDLEAYAKMGNIPYKEAIALKERVAELEKALEEIKDYWNKHENYSAMNDALYHITEVAEQVLSKENK